MPFCRLVNLTLPWFVLCVSLQPLIAEDVPAGHSFHGEAFNEGPRQTAYLREGTGNVSFPATTKNELVQKFISQGVGQLHGFWYFEAERSFRQAASIDPDCAIAYWGMAMSNAGRLQRRPPPKGLSHGGDGKRFFPGDNKK